MELHLMEKTEIFIENIHLDHVNLDAAAAAVAAVMNLDRCEVSVIDVRPGILALDILKKTVTVEQIAGKGPAILRAVGAVSGISLDMSARIHSEGILGLVNLPDEKSDGIAERVERISREISETVRHRAMVIPTGDELINGSVEDTNTPLLVKLLKNQGYHVVNKPPVADSRDKLTALFSSAIADGFGLVITTGGVGAEDKDFTVEAILALDQEATVRYIVHYTPGQGRHKKDGVKICVGQTEFTMFIALPGPHDEVNLAVPVLVEGLNRQWPKDLFAEKLAVPLRRKWSGHTEHLHRGHK